MDIEIRDERVAEGRYAAYLDGQRLGLATWVKVHDTVVLPHTEVDPEWEGHGVGSLLARRAFDDARADGLAVLPFCPFMRHWAELHPDYQDVVRPLRTGELPSIEDAVRAARTPDPLTNPTTTSPATSTPSTPFTITTPPATTTPPTTTDASEPHSTPSAPAPTSAPASTPVTPTGP